jgi:hypothetical protein
MTFLVRQNEFLVRQKDRAFKNNYKFDSKFRLPQPSTCNIKIVSSANPGKIQKINDYVNIKDTPWCTLGPSCGPRAGVILHH